MTLLLEFSPQSVSDLEDIQDWIAADSPLRAISFVDDLQVACNGLTENPERFQIVHKMGSKQIRHRPFGNFLIYYTFNATTVSILRVVNASRDRYRLF